jgi:alpha-beta hydrolase superfamily lysophospholipase
VTERAALTETLPPGALPIVFGPPDRALLGFYHAPAGLPGRALAVVLCNPLGYEAMSVHRTYRHLAERLAARGFPALRFDYDGTGDSAGRSDDPGRVAAWVGGIKAALSEVRARAGTRTVALFGVRFGATLATLAAAEDGDVESLIAWAPIVSGRLHVRELRAFRLIQDPRTPVPQRRDGSEEVGGYVYTAETLSEMSAIDLFAESDRVAKRVLVLPPNERSRDESRFVGHLKASGVEATLAPGSGYARMMRDDPYESLVPFETMETVVEWLSEGIPTKAQAPASTLPASNVIRVADRDGKATLKETALLFGDGARLFGVLTEPQGTPRRDRPVLCFLNVGSNHHVGPHRMNVELARELASRGYPSFRFDAAGLGDSRVEPGVRENRIYTKDSIADVKSAMTLLGEVCGARRFVLVGLCSGAYLAFHTTIVDPRVVGQVLLSPYAFEWEEGDPVTPTMRKPFRSTRFYTRALFDHRVWLRALRGDVELRAIAGALLERLQSQVDVKVPALSARLRGKRRPHNDVERAFGAICDRGVESLLVLSFEDGGVDMVAGYLGTDARKMRGRKNFSFEIVDGADHIFTTTASQVVLRELLRRYLSSRFP